MFRPDPRKQEPVGATLLRPYIAAVMLPLYTDALDPLAEFRRLGIDASLAWHADHDHASLVFIATDAENLGRLDRWLEARPRIAVAELVA